MSVKIGQRIAIKPSAGASATSGVVRAVCGEGRTATYEVDAVDQTGYRTTHYLARSEFTLRKPA